MDVIDATVRRLGARRACAIVRTHDEELALRALEAAVAGGFRVLEITLTTPGATTLLRRFARDADLLVGAGTVLTPDDAGRAVDAGAAFLVSPVADKAAIAAARALDVPMIAGAHTPTELLQAHRLGAPLQKLFPAPAGGPTWLRAVLGPLPFLRVIPTNGVDGANVGAWFAAGAVGVGFAATLFVAEDMAARDFAAIEARARALVAASQASPAGAPQPG
jgi:2-dehydro-3-deoxyphosphogluconate aldolase/(4S)-4-hydroxy-2-oxoglutarate aldolase